MSFGSGNKNGTGSALVLALLPYCHHFILLEHFENFPELSLLYVHHCEVRLKYPKFKAKGLLVKDVCHDNKTKSSPLLIYCTDFLDLFVFLDALCTLYVWLFWMICSIVFIQPSNVHCHICPNIENHIFLPFSSLPPKLVRPCGYLLKLSQKECESRPQLLR